MVQKASSKLIVGTWTGAQSSRQWKIAGIGVRNSCQNRKHKNHRPLVGVVLEIAPHRIILLLIVAFSSPAALGFIVGQYRVGNHTPSEIKLRPLFVPLSETFTRCCEACNPRAREMRFFDVPNNYIGIS